VEFEARDKSTNKMNQLVWQLQNLTTHVIYKEVAMFIVSTEVIHTGKTLLRSFTY